MSFAQLQQTILDEARQQADEIKGRYKQSVEKEEARIKEGARVVEEQIIDQAKQVGERKSKRLHQEAQLAARADILRVKQEELDKTIRVAQDTIMSWDEVKTKFLIKSLLAQLPEGKGSIVPGAKHQDLVRREAEKGGHKVRDESQEDDGGFVYSDTKMEVNVLVSKLVRGVFARYRTKVAKTLFD